MYYPFLFSVASSVLRKLDQCNLQEFRDSKGMENDVEMLKAILNHLPSILEEHDESAIHVIQKSVYGLHDLFNEQVHPRLKSSWSSLIGPLTVLQLHLYSYSSEESLLPSVSFALPKIDDVNKVVELPSYLVPCLAYCALYPKGYRIVRETLVNQWMAEGFLEVQAAGSSSSEMESEDIGNRYFCELLSMGVFFEPVYCFGGNKNNQQEAVTVYSCELQPDMHGFARNIARKEVSVLDNWRDYDSDYDYDAPESTIYMALHKDVRLKLQPSSIRAYLHFMSHVSKAALESVVSNLSELQILNLAGVKFEELPESFRNLGRLRYLAYSGNNSLKSIDWSSMHQLQTLAIDECVRLEHINLKHTSLMRHLYYTSKDSTLEIHTSTLRILQLSHCPQLTSLSLSGVANFSSLRRLRIFECPRLSSLPDSVDLLSHVEELIFHNCARLDLNCGRSMNFLPKLQHVELIGLPKMAKLSAGLETTDALNYLMIADCVSLKSTDPVLKHLHTLEKLCVYNCRNLSIDPCEFRSLTALQSLDISRNTFKKGQDIWPFIFNIPEIILDGQLLDRKAGLGPQVFGDQTDSYTPMNFPYFIISLETCEANKSFQAKAYTRPKIQLILRKVQIQRQNNDEGFVRGLYRKYKIKHRYWLGVKLAFRAMIKMRVLQLKIIHCCLCPSNYEFERDKLAQLWMARGHIDEEPWGKLQWRFFCLEKKERITKTREDILTEISKYKINVDNVEPFLHRVKSEDRYTLIEDEKFGVHTSLSRYVFVASKSIEETMFKTLERFSELKSIILIPDYGPSLKQIPSTFFESLPLMHTLDISGSHIMELPSSIGKMIHLRFLDLSFTLIQRIPESICHLQELQTLRLKGCKHLHTLPEAMKELVNLYHLDFDVLGQLTSMPKGLGSLSKLHTLSAFIVSEEEGCGIEELYKMDYLSGNFCISGLEHVSSDNAWKARLRSKRHLSQLHLKWSHSTHYDDQDREDACETLEGLQPSSSLFKSSSLVNLTISYYPGMNLPKWIQNVYYDLVSITLVGCEIEVLCTLEMLPELKHLYVYDLNRVKEMNTSVNHHMYGKRYPKLKTLDIDGMPLAERWSSEVGDGDFPCLSEVSIQHCPNLTGLPFLPYPKSLTYLEISYCKSFKELPPGELSPSLKTIMINHCPELKTRCSVGGYDWEKIKHVEEIWIDMKDVRSTHEDTDTVSEDEDDDYDDSD